MPGLSEHPARWEPTRFRRAGLFSVCPYSCKHPKHSINMKHYADTSPYEAPRISCVQIAVEKGFAVSIGNVTVDPWNDGGTIGGGEAEEIFY